MRVQEESERASLRLNIKKKTKIMHPAPLLLLLLSHFSGVQLCVTPQIAAHQAPLSLGFSRQEHQSGLPFPSPRHESENEVPQSCPTLHDPMDCSPPRSSVHGIFQARVLEQVAIAFLCGKQKGKQQKQWQISSPWAPKSLQTVTAAMKSEDSCFLAGKL